MLWWTQKRWRIQQKRNRLSMWSFKTLPNGTHSIHHYQYSSQPYSITVFQIPSCHITFNQMTLYYNVMSPHVNLSAILILKQRNEKEVKLIIWIFDKIAAIILGELRNGVCIKTLCLPPYFQKVRESIQCLFHFFAIKTR